MAYIFTPADPSYGATPTGAVSGVRLTENEAGVFPGRAAGVGFVTSGGASLPLALSGQQSLVVGFVADPGGVAAPLPAGLHEFFVAADVLRDTVNAPNTTVSGLFYVDGAGGGHNATVGAYDPTTNSFAVTLASGVDAAYGVGGFTVSGAGFTTSAALTGQSVAAGVDTLTYTLAARPPATGGYSVYATGYDVGSAGAASTPTLSVTVPYLPPTPAQTTAQVTNASAAHAAAAAGVHVSAFSASTNHAVALGGGLAGGLGGNIGGYANTVAQADTKQSDAEADSTAAQAAIQATIAQDIAKATASNLEELVGVVTRFLKDVEAARNQQLAALTHADATASVHLAAPAEIASTDAAAPPAAAATTTTTPALNADGLTTVQATDLQDLSTTLTVALKVALGQLSAADGQSVLFHLADGTTSAAEIAYAFFTGRTPTAAGLDYLLNTDGSGLKSDAYAGISTENRYISLAAALGSGSGAGAAAFASAYGGLSLQDATAKAYAAVFGFTPTADKVAALLNASVADGHGGIETRAQYFADITGGSSLAQKAAVAGFLLADSVKEGFGVYQQADQHFLQDLAQGGGVYGVDLLAAYAAPPALVGHPAASG